MIEHQALRRVRSYLSASCEPSRTGSELFLHFPVLGRWLFGWAFPSGERAAGGSEPRCLCGSPSPRRGRARALLAPRHLGVDAVTVLHPAPAKARLGDRAHQLFPVGAGRPAPCPGGERPSPAPGLPLLPAGRLLREVLEGRALLLCCTPRPAKGKASFMC